MRVTDRRTVLFLVLAAAGLLAAPAGAAAHEELTDAAPADGDELAIAPRQLRLTFLNPIQLSLAHLSLVGPDGAVELGELRRASDAARVLVGPIRGALVAGSYTVRWQVAGPDGHPVRGEYTFTILPDAEGLTPDTDPVPAAEPHDPGHDPDADAFPLSDFDSASPLYAAVRWLTFLGLLGVIGAAAFRLLVLGFLERSGNPAGVAVVADASGRAAWIGLGAATVLAGTLFLRLYAQLYALHGPADTMTLDRISALLGGTTWGTGWWLQAIGTGAAALGFAIARRRDRPGWGVAAIAALLLAFTPALSGHAAGARELAWLAIAADGLHVLGAGGWLGGLLLVVAVGLPVTLRPRDRHVAPGAAAAALIHAFSPTALFFAGVVVATGVVSAWLHVGAVSALWTSAYGRTLLLKLGVLSLVFGTGAYNWLRVKPALGDTAAARRLRRSALLELAIAALVLAVTAVLVATPLPTETPIP